MTGKGWGQIGGSVLGGLLGLIAGPAGATAGASLGGMLGGQLGGLGDKPDDPNAAVADQMRHQAAAAPFQLPNAPSVPGATPSMTVGPQGSMMAADEPDPKDLAMQQYMQRMKGGGLV